MGDNGVLPRPLLDRLNKHTIRTDDGCWVWTGHVVRQGSMAYGRTSTGSKRDGTYRAVLVHRVAYELLVGPIPEGLTIDHLCSNPLCWNPEHLEACTLRDNILRGVRSPTAVNARKTHCSRCGGEFTTRPQGGRYCRPCQLAYFREYNAARGKTPVPRRKMGWSVKHAQCVDCGTTDRPHICHGRCSLCHERQRVR